MNCFFPSPDLKIFEVVAVFLNEANFTFKLL
jgi:hypothetical protein